MIKKNYDSIDLMKFIASIFVVSIHSNALRDVSPLANVLITQGIARLAVPLFFIASAFFYFREPLTAEKVKKYCLRIGKLYILWFIISLPITVYNRFIQSDYSMTVTVLRFIRTIFFTSTFSGSWFLTSCVFCALIFYALEKLENGKRRTVTVLISVLSYLLCVFTSAYGKLMEPLGLTGAYAKMEVFFANPYTSILVGIPYFALGRCLAKDKRPAAPKILTLACVILLLGEVYITYRFGSARTTDCYLMLLPGAYCIFTAVMNCGKTFKHAKALRNSSTVIYFSHFIWLFVLEFAEFFFKITIPCIGKFLIAVTLSLITYAVFTLLQRHKLFRWIRYLY